jgi:hypothetical protein
VLEGCQHGTGVSILRFVAIQGIKRKEDLADLAPKGCFISAEAIERVIGQIGETQKATRELSGLMDRWFLSSETKCNTPADLIIGTADQDLRECCHGMLFAFVG